MNSESSFCVVGSLNMDFVIPVPHLPKEGETLFGGKYQTIAGGKGANQAVGLARLGGEVALIGKVGADDFGKALCAGLENERVNVSGIYEATEARTGCAFILVAETGRNIIVVSPGANAAWTREEIDIARGCAVTAGCVVLQGEIPPAVNLAVAQAAREAHTRVIWNPAPAYMDLELLSLADVVIPNEVEVIQLAGLLGRPPESITEAASLLVEHGAKAVVVTVGEEGAWLATRQGVSLFAAFPVKAVDTTAAGDAFVAGFSMALSCGFPLSESIRWGNAAGAIAASRWGAQPSLPSAEELRQMMANSH